MSTPETTDSRDVLVYIGERLGALHQQINDLFIGLHGRLDRLDTAAAQRQATFSPAPRPDLDTPEYRRTQTLRRVGEDSPAP
jgi:hypothetical protein